MLGQAGSFESMVAAAPALILQAIPAVCRAELRVTRRGRVTGSAADTRPGPHLASLPAGRSVLTFPVSVETGARAGETSGAAPGGSLTVFTDTPSGFDDVTAWTASILAGQVEAALACAATRGLAGQLQVAVETNRDIGVAIGILMAAQDLTREQAYQVLRTISQHTNRRLAQVAGDLIHAGWRPPPPRPPWHPAAPERERPRLIPVPGRRQDPGLTVRSLP